MMNWKDMEGDSHDLIEVLTQSLFGGTDENNENLRCDEQDSNQAPPEYKSTALPLDQPVLFSDQNTNLRIQCSNIATTDIKI
jgi:hypothetical protein